MNQICMRYISNDKNKTKHQKKKDCRGKIIKLYLYLLYGKMYMYISISKYCK